MLGIRRIKPAVLVLLAACANPVSPNPDAGLQDGAHGVSAVPAGRSIRVSNRSQDPIFYTVLESGLATVANWTPCTKPDVCAGVQPGQEVAVPHTKIEGYNAASRGVIMYWWHLRPDPDGRLVAETIHAIPVQL